MGKSDPGDIPFVVLTTKGRWGSESEELTFHAQLGMKLLPSSMSGEIHTVWYLV